MLGKTFIIGGFAALLAAVAAVPASAQGLCNGVAGNALCGAGIGGGLGAALGGNKGAKTGAIIGGVLGATQGLQQQQPPPPQPYYRQPAYAPPPPPPPRYTYRRAYAPAYSNELVYNIQTGLLQLGYNPGPADGVYGRGTGTAIQTYQNDNGLLVDGKPSPQLYAHMQQYLN